MSKEEEAIRLAQRFRHYADNYPSAHRGAAWITSDEARRAADFLARATGTAQEPKALMPPDWQPVHAALEAVYPPLGLSMIQDGSSGRHYHAHDWNLAVALREYFERKFSETRGACRSCGAELNFDTLYRCADCNMALCKNCTKEHFGPNHKPHTAPPAQGTDALQDMQTQLAKANVEAEQARKACEEVRGTLRAELAEEKRQHAITTTQRDNWCAECERLNLLIADLRAQGTDADSIHSCSYYCQRPECIKAQRDELVKKMEEADADKARIESRVPADCVVVPREDAPEGWVYVPFQVQEAAGWVTYRVLCPDAPSKTATGLQLKAAANIPANYDLIRDEDMFEHGKYIGDGNAVILAEDGSSKFCGIPPAHY